MHKPLLTLEQTHIYLEIVEASLAVTRREQFFTFLQGCFQYLFPHEILICAHEGVPGQYYFESYSSSRYFDDRQLARSTSSDGVVWRVLGAWKAKRCPIIISDSHQVGDFSNYSVPFEEAAGGLQDSELHHVIAHGMCGRDGRVESFFCFSRLPKQPDAEHASLLQWLTPYLHAALVRTRYDTLSSKLQPRLPVNSPAMTEREIEILGWITLGKTNWEISSILEISPLTVKNHVQNIFRKLNVQTRQEAAWRAGEGGLLQQSRQYYRKS